MVVDGAALDEQALRQLGNLAVKAGHDVGHGLHKGDLRRTEGRGRAARLVGGRVSVRLPGV